MAKVKSDMRRANRAWRTETRALGWHRGWKGGKKDWKSFCRTQAEVTVDCLRSDYPGEMWATQDDVVESVQEELSEWN